MTSTCIFCNQAASISSTGEDFNKDIKSVNCLICGNYKITQEAWNDFSESPYKNDAIKISAFINKQNIRKLTEQVICYSSPSSKNNNLISLDEIIKDFPKSLSERLDNALINLAKMSDFTGNYLDFTLSKKYPIFYPDNKNIASARFIVMQLITDNYIEFQVIPDIINLQNFAIRLTHKGWNRVAELESTNKNSKKVFVAMWFSDKMKETFEKYIQPAVAEAKEGYNALHIGKKEHNNDINDEIIAEIKTSKFVIADLTGDRGGVYYEAGFAKGLGIPVIFTCHSDWFNKEIIQKVEDKDDQAKTVNIKINRKVHFDVSTINIIVWEDGEELGTKLINRIKATID